MNDKHEATASAPESVQQIIAAIEAIDGKLSEHLAANGAPDNAASVEKARALLREAIGILTPAVPSDAGGEAGSAKKRVKIKAESEIASASESPRSTAAKGGTSRAKPPRGNRASDAAQTDREPANGEKASNGSLLARLGAAAQTSPPPSTPVEPAAESAPPAQPENAVDVTAQRLAQLEAEIADLTEAVTATPTRPVSLPATARLAEPEQKRAAVPAASEMVTSALSDQDIPSEDDEIAEITIIGADGAPSAPANRAERHAPRIFREGPSMAEEEAEVEIRGTSANRPARRSSDSASSAHKSPAGEKSEARGKWRLFRGSR